MFTIKLTGEFADWLSGLRQYPDAFDKLRLLDSPRRAECSSSACSLQSSMPMKGRRMR
jgi:hypothetical protein